MGTRRPKIHFRQKNIFCRISLIFALVMEQAHVHTDDVVQDEILRAALRLYQKSGPDKVTMDDVAKATGRSRTSLYYYYKNRDEVLHAVIDTLTKDVAADIRAAVSATDTLSDKIYAFCMTKLKTSQEWKPLFSAMWASVDGDDKVKHNKLMDVLHKKLVYQEAIILNEILAITLSGKEFRTLGASEQDTLVFIISSGIRGLRREIYDQNDPHDIKAAVQLLTDMIVRWLRV